MTSLPQRHGLLAKEVAVLLNLTPSEFTRKVTEGIIPPAFYRDADGIEQWDRQVIGALVAKQLLGPSHLRGLRYSNKRRVVKHSADFNADQVIAMLAPVFPGMNSDRLAQLIEDNQFPVFDYVKQGEPYWYASTTARYLVR